MGSSVFAAFLLLAIATSFHRGGLFQPNLLVVQTFGALIALWVVNLAFTTWSNPPAEVTSDAFPRWAWIGYGAWCIGSGLFIFALLNLDQAIEFVTIGVGVILWLVGGVLSDFGSDAVLADDDARRARPVANDHAQVG